MSPPRLLQTEPSKAPPRLLRLAGIALAILIALVGLRIAATDRIAPSVPDNTPASILIDINSATESELGALPRIGPGLARRIVEDRSVSGEYLRLDDLDRVPGIGPRTIDAIRPYAVAR